MAGGLVEHPGAVHHRSALGVVRTEDQAPDPRMADGAGAHGAGLQRHRQAKAGQPIIAQLRGGGAEREDLGMGGGIVRGDRLVRRDRDHLAGLRIEHHRAHRSFAGGGGGLRRFEGDAHGALSMVHDPHRTGQAPSGQARNNDEGPADDRADRIAKALARAGVGSRRDVERLIAEGRVALNGQLLTTPAVKVEPGDILTVDGQVVGETEPARLFRYHKPVGLVTTHKDPQGRPTVFEALPKGLPRLISVGRLDLNSEGLLLLTNDGGLARGLELPGAGIVRRYRARAHGRVSQERLDKLKDGVTIEGVRYGPIEARLDLHGMTQAEAHRALAGFIRTARGGGKRCVLVITGRGAPRDHGGAGVLREAVPRWLAEPGLRPHLLAIATAQPQDGGAGALYVMLRRTDRTAGR